MISHPPALAQTTGIFSAGLPHLDHSGHDCTIPKGSTDVIPSLVLSSIRVRVCLTTSARQLLAGQDRFVNLFICQTT